MGSIENAENEVMKTRSVLLKGANIVNEGKNFVGDVLVKDGIIERIDTDISADHVRVLDLTDHFLLPGCIDDQVHFREPGLTHKANIHTESRAAVAGGITSFMEMPNTVPNALTQELLEDKFQLASSSSVANFSFFMELLTIILKKCLKPTATRFVV